MPLVTRLEDEFTRPGLHHIISKQRTDAPFRYVAVFVLARMPMQRRAKGTRRHRVFDEREPTAGFNAIDHETHPHASEEARVAVTWTEDPWRRSVHFCSPWKTLIWLQIVAFWLSQPT